MSRIRVLLDGMSRQLRTHTSFFILDEQAHRYMPILVNVETQRRLRCWMRDKVINRSRIAVLLAYQKYGQLCRLVQITVRKSAMGKASLQTSWKGQSTLEYLVVLVGFLSMICTVGALYTQLHNSDLYQRASQSIDHQLKYDAINILLY